MNLRHVHLPGLTPYLRASAIQEHLFRLQLDHKIAHPSRRSSVPAPAPVLLTFQTPPTYTCGRRETGALSDEQKQHLRAGGKAEFHEAPRGGQITFHGPGQVTAYLILSLQEHKLTPKTHVRLLEDSVIGTCEKLGLEAHTTENQGVWIGLSPNERKLASVGVHLRRHVASHGIALNVSVRLWWFVRIVACGLPDKKVTSIRREIEAMDTASNATVLGPPAVPGRHRRKLHFANVGRMMQQVTATLAHQVASRLSGVDGRVEGVAEKSLRPEKVHSES